MFEKLIDWYLHDEEKWVRTGNSIDAKSIEDARSILGNRFIDSFIRFHGLHDMKVLSISVNLGRMGTDLLILLYDDDVRSQIIELSIKNCSEVHITDNNEKHLLCPPELLIMTFEQKGDSFYSGIALSEGQRIMITSTQPKFILKKHVP